MNIGFVLDLIEWVVSELFGQQKGTAAPIYDRIKAAVQRFADADLDGDGKREGVVAEVLGWGAGIAVRDIHLAIQLALKEMELSNEQQK